MEISARRTNGLEVALIDVREPLFHELLRPLVQLREVLGRVADVAVPLEPEPFDVLDDGVDELRGLGLGVGVVKAKVTTPVLVELCEGEVHEDALGVPYVKVAVGFRRETRVDAATFGAGGEICADAIGDEITRSIGLCGSMFTHARHATSGRTAIQGNRA